jgi:four helix bundle protein
MSLSSNLLNLEKDLERKEHDLIYRTTEFGKNVIIFCKKLKPDLVSAPLISQIVRSATSVGANYREANSAGSKKDFRNKIVIARKEISETEHWITLLATCYPQHKDELRILWQENHELLLIFSKILLKLDKQ